MKKYLPYLLAVILTVIIFTGCSVSLEEDDYFEPGDTLVVSVGETYYKFSSLWFRLDSIIEDTRNPGEGTGRVRIMFTLHDRSRFNDRSEILSSDADMHFILQTFHYPSSNVDVDYKYSVIDVSPFAIEESECKQSDYRVTMVCEEWLVYAVY